ncbi:MAG: cupin domain-containing protein [Deltaproteobacteria bacterium]|nr:cupin domain-containing protein [Deltaproteobacteria bacterium]
MRRINADVEDLGIGSKIREHRRRCGLTLQALSGRTGLSKPLLSQVENGRVMPPVATLLKIARALDVSLSQLFQEDRREDKVALTRAAERGRFTTRPHQQARDAGYSYESLELHRPRKAMQPLLVTFQPLEEKDAAFYTHEGEECVVLLEGELEFRGPDERRVLLPGDCLYFDSDLPHAFRSLGGQPARALVVVYAGAPPGKP